MQWKKLLKPIFSKYDISVVLGEGEESLEALAGEGEFFRPEDQVMLPTDVLDDIKAATKTALLKTSDGTTTLQNFSSIYQGIGETFIKFVDHFQETIEHQIDNVEARDELLRKMVMTNANVETKKILRALPQEPEPTIPQMVDGHTKASSLEQLWHWLSVKEGGRKW
ncbi:hypothetical protein EK904_012233 [Melospiza melodia maxima]|nr:hypothetical protein EK904_012233 [Melospiza melodia maxima]